MRNGEHQDRTTTRTSDQILGEIRDYCRATQTAESTFGRLVVNDGKLVSRLRDGAKITTGTLDKVRAYLAEHRAASPSAQARAPIAVHVTDIATCACFASSSVGTPPPTMRPNGSTTATEAR